MDHLQYLISASSSSIHTPSHPLSVLGKNPIRSESGLGQLSQNPPLSQKFPLSNFPATDPHLLFGSKFLLVDTVFGVESPNPGQIPLQCSSAYGEGPG